MVVNVYEAQSLISTVTLSKTCQVSHHPKSSPVHAIGLMERSLIQASPRLL